MRRSMTWMLGITLITLIATTLAMRFELAEPGISGLFAGRPTASSPNGLFAATAYELTVLFHHVLGLILCLSIAWVTLRTTPNGGNRDAGAMAWVFALFAGLTVAATLLFMTSAELALLSVPGGEGLRQWLTLPEQVTDVIVMLRAMQAPLIVVGTVMGAALMMAKTQAEQRAAWVIVVVALLSLLGLAYMYDAERIPTLGNGGLSVALLGLVALLAFFQSDGDRPGSVYLLIGAILSIAAQITTNAYSGPDGMSGAGTMWDVAHSHMALFSLSLFAGFAVLDVRWHPQLPRPIIWAHGLALGFAGAAAFVPLALLGRQGMPRRYPDYPSAFADLNYAASIGTYTLLTLIALGVFLMWQTRRQRPDPPVQPTKHAPQTAPIPAAHPPSDGVHLRPSNSPQ